MRANDTLAIIGVGNMGKALMDGILKAAVLQPRQIVSADTDSKRLSSAHKEWGIRTFRDNREAAAEADVVLLAVKPQVILAVCRDVADRLQPDKLAISIAAGISTQSLEAALGRVPVVRVMPNTPALVGSGMSALCGGQHAGSKHLEEATKLLGCVGETVVVEEQLMDAVTGLSGSGPAYVFELIDAMADGGVKMGLAKPLALRLAVQTVFGAARMVAETHEHPAVLRDRVTSPGGTTIAGLHQLAEKQFRDAVMSAVQAAALRSAELGGT